jgi:aspartate carbamoyltransferase catalytic subunit
MLLHFVNARVIDPATLMPAGVLDFGCEVLVDTVEWFHGCDVVKTQRLKREQIDGGFVPLEREFYRRYGLDAE